MKSTAGKVLITGSSGMLGVDLCQELDKSYDVFGMDIIDHRPKTTDLSLYPI